MWRLISCGLALLVLVSLNLTAQSQDNAYFPSDNFFRSRNTLPDSQLDFTDDTQESCCADDAPVVDPNAPTGSSFKAENPSYTDYGNDPKLVECEKMQGLSAVGQMGEAPVQVNVAHNLPIKSNSTNVSVKKKAEFYTDPRRNLTTSFHISTQGGASLVQLQDVTHYSVCMGRGGNSLRVHNTDNGSILTYNGNDHVVLGGNNTNMLTRTGAGDDVIEIAQTVTQPSGWKANSMFKTAISGSDGVDTLVINATPPGTKWCHIGGYTLFGEYFYVVEFALPPSATEGPRRQRMSIGQSVEYVVFKGRKYATREFLAHGTPFEVAGFFSDRSF